MSKRVFIILILFIATQSAFAQKFTAGYYVKASGDTVKTNVFLRKKSGHILGLLSEDGQLFGPKDLRAASVGRISYVVKKVTIDKSPKGSTAVDTMFLEIMSREKMSLFHSVDENNKAHFFIEDEDGTTTELGLHILDQGDGITFQELPIYKDVLKTLFATCKDLTGEIDKSRYTRNSIHTVFEKLYECKYGTAPKMATTRHIVNDFGIVAGISSTTLKFENKPGNTSLAARLVFDKSTDLTGGVFMESRFTKLGKSFTVRNELTHRTYDVASEDYYNGQGQTSLFGYVSANYLKYNLLARLALSHNELRPFITAGLSPSLLLSSSNRSLVITNGSKHTESLLGRVKSFEFGYFFGAGLMYNGFSIEARVEQSTGLHPETCNSKVNTLFVLLSYRLFEGNY